MENTIDFLRSVYHKLTTLKEHQSSMLVDTAIEMIEMAEDIAVKESRNAAQSSGGQSPQAPNSPMREITEVLSRCKGASVSDQNNIDIAVIKLRQLQA